MTANLHGFFQSLTDAILANEPQLVTGRYRLPLPIFFDHGRVALTTPADLLHYLNGMHQALKAHGISRIHARIARAEKPVDGRFRVWVHFSDASGTDLGETSHATYYCLNGPNGPQIAMASHGCQAEQELAAALGPALHLD